VKHRVHAITNHFASNSTSSKCFTVDESQQSIKGFRKIISISSIGKWFQKVRLRTRVSFAFQINSAQAGEEIWLQEALGPTFWCTKWLQVQRMELIQSLLI